MTDLIAKIFIKDYKNVKNPTVRKNYGTLASTVGILSNVLLFAIKLLAGLVTGSVAIMADATNNLSDAGTSVVSLISFKMASKPADKDHPFGHARIEYIASMIVSFLILFVGISFLSDSVKKMFGLAEVDLRIEILPVILLIISIVIKFIMAAFYRSVSKKIDSSVIKAAAFDSLTDSIATLTVLISSIIVKHTGFMMIDSIVGTLVSLLILFAGVKILNETKNSLLGEAPTKEVVESIEKIIENYPEIIGIHDMIVHNYGPNHYFASFHAEVDGKRDIYMLHDHIDNAEKQISTDLGIQCTIHMDPIVTDDERITALKELVINITKELDESISIHDFRAVIGTTHTNLIFDVAIPFDSKISPKEAQSFISDKVNESNSSYFCVITVDRV
jgi:cation diffusion facilitator family transporter